MNTGHVLIYSIVQLIFITSLAQYFSLMIEKNLFATSKDGPPGYHDNWNDWQVAQFPQWKGGGGKGRHLVQRVERWCPDCPRTMPGIQHNWSWTNQLTVKPWTDAKALIFNVFPVMRPNFNITPEIRLMPEVSFSVFVLNKKKKETYLRDLVHVLKDYFYTEILDAQPRKPQTWDKSLVCFNWQNIEYMGAITQNSTSRSKWIEETT